MSHVFGKGHKMHFKKTIFDVFCPFYGLTLKYYCSVICQCRMLIFFRALRAPPSSSCRGHWGALRAPTTSQKCFLHKQMTEKITYKSWAKKLAKNVKNCFFKVHFMTTSKNVRQIPKPFLERFFLVVF